MKFKSIQSKLLLIITIGLVLMATVLATFSITITHGILHTDADALLSAQCEKEATEINDVLGSIEHSVAIMRHYASTELNDDPNVITDESLQAEYLQKMDVMFREITLNTPGAIGYYIRFNHTLTSPTAGFFYSVDQATKTITAQPTTDLTLYDPERDSNKVGWYYQPRRAAKAMWLAPYQSDEDDAEIISFVMPYFAVNGTTFIGVIGIDVPYSFLTDKVASIAVHDNGNATLSQTPPEVHAHSHTRDTAPTAHAYQALKNGLYLVLNAQYSDIQRESRAMLYIIAAIATVITAIFVLITFYATSKITKPLKQLAHSANELADGNYDANFQYDGDDEIGTVAASLKLAAAKLKESMNHFSALAFHDALTGVRSTAAFNQAVADLNLLLENVHRDFAVVVADVNFLKITNDTYGHAVGNQLILHTANVLTETFKNSYVYRIGGDEFAVILDGDDYDNREALMAQLEEKSVGSIIRINDGEELAVSFAFGMASYAKELDTGFDDVLKHADSAMYLHKRALKRSQLQVEQENP